MKRVRGLFQKYLPNRSSKDLYFAGLVGPGTKPAIWSWSGKALHDAAVKCGDSKSNPFDREIQRRLRNAEKRKTPRPAAKKACTEGEVANG